MNKKIYIKDWLKMKPYQTETKADIYYLKIANEIKKIIVKDKEECELLIHHLTNYDEHFFDSTQINLLSCFLASYFEDIISETNIWNSFVRKHTELYNKPLPFFHNPEEEYFENEINEQDISFLIWYFVSQFQKEHINFIFALNDFENIVSKIFNLFDKEYEYAPVNEQLQSEYQLPTNTTDYFQIRDFIENIYSYTYLFYPDTSLQLQNILQKIVSKFDLDDKNKHLLYERKNMFIHKNRTSLLALKGNEWLAEIIGKTHPLYNDLLAISPRITGYFLYKGEDKDNIFTEYIATGEKFTITKKSFTPPPSIEIDYIMYLSIIEWKKEWWFNGISSIKPYDKEFIQKEKTSANAVQMTSFLPEKQKEVQDILEKHKNYFLEFNNNSLIAFMKKEKINDFMNAFYDFYNQQISKLLNQEKQETPVGIFDFPTEKEITSGLCFFNDKTGIEILFDCNNLFPLPNNPFFDEEKAKKDPNDFLNMIMTDSISSEIIMFCINHCKDKLPFFETEIGKNCLENIDFLLRFWKKENYYTTAAILVE